MNLKACESNGPEFASVNYILASAAEQSARHDNISSLHHKSIKLMLLKESYM